MQYRKAVLASLVVGIVVAFAASAALAQARGQGREGGNDRGQGRGNFDPAQWQQRIAERMKTSLGMTDEEWTAVQPLVEKVQTLNREAVQMRFGRGNRGNRGGRGGRGDDQPATEEATQPVSPLAQAFQELQTVVGNADATTEDIQAKLTAYREAREKAKQELDAAKQALREVLTLRQEAVLVTRGILD